MKKKEHPKQPCEETCKGYKQLGIDACQGCAGNPSTQKDR
jgi:hypothetical protein